MEDFMKKFQTDLMERQKEAADKAWESFLDPENIAKWNRHAHFNNEVINPLRYIFGMENPKRILSYFRNHWRDLRHAPWRKM